MRNNERDRLVESLERLTRWKIEAIAVIARWDATADKVPDSFMRLGYNKSEEVGRYIDHLHARIAELEAIPPHPAFLPYVLTDLSMHSIIVKTEGGYRGGWVHIGPEPPVPMYDPAWPTTTNGTIAEGEHHDCA